jgi:hypothetical protein
MILGDLLGFCTPSRLRIGLCDSRFPFTSTALYPGPLAIPLEEGFALLTLG